MIDIVFQLLIFFLTTAQVVHLSRAQLDLPQEPGEQSKTAEQAGLIINLLPGGEMIVSDRQVNLDDLTDLVRDAIRQTPNQKPENVRLIIRADRNASSASLNALVERLHQLGVGAARIATSPPRS